MKKYYLPILFIALCSLFSSCSKNDILEEKGSGTITFNLNSSSKALSKAMDFNSKQDSLGGGDPFAIIISIIDNKGASVVTTEQIPLYNFNGNYISKPISLKPGDYKLTDFLVIDTNGNVIYLTPKEGSPKAYLVNDPLPVGFNIIKDQVANVNVEVLRNLGEVPSDFGYSTFTFNVVDVFSFNLGVLVYSDNIQNFIMTDAEIVISKNETKIFEGILLPKTNIIALRKDYGIYNLLIRKTGYENYSVDFSLADLQTYINKPLIVILNKTTLTLPDGLVAYYPFNGNANDESGNNLNSPNFYADLIADRYGNPNKAYHFNGIDQYIDFPNNAVLKPQFPFTISFWVKLDQYDNSNQILTTDYKLDYYTGVWFVIATGRVTANYGDGTYINVNARRGFTGKSVLNLNQWYHVCCVFKSSTDAEMYLNGVNDGVEYTGGATNLVYSNNSGSVGRKDCGNDTQPPYYFKGSVDDIAFYNRVLTESEVKSVYLYK